MIEKIYTFNGSEFTTEKHVLKVMKFGKPLQDFFNKEIQKRIKSNPAMEAERKVLIDLSDMINKDTAYLEEIKDGKNVSEIKRVKEILKSNTKKKTDLEKKFNENKEYIKLLEDDRINLIDAFQCLIYEFNLITPFLENYLIGDVEKIDYTDEKVIPFISEIIADFFLKLQGKT